MGYSTSFLRFELAGAESFRNVQKALTDANRQLPRDNKVSINEVAAVLRDAARAAVLNEPSGGKGHTGLRQQIAKGITYVQIPNGVRMVSQMDDYSERNLPRDVGDPRGWRHPVFGRQTNWVTQHMGDDDWFLRTMSTGEAPLRDKLIRNIENIAEQIAGSA